MGANKDLTLEERRKIARLLTQSISKSGIADILNRSKTCILNETKRYDKTKIYDPEIAHQEAQERKKQRLDNLKTTFTPKQLAAIKEGIELRLPVGKIRDLAGTNYEKIRRYFAENNISYVPYDFKEIIERISCLEMQIEILTDQIKEMNERNLKNH